MPYRYVPLLRTKAGEVTALNQLANAAKDTLMPLMHIVASPAPTFAASLVAAWSGRPLALHGGYNFGAAGSMADFSAIFDGLGAGGVPVIPSVSVRSPQAYVQAAIATLSRYGPGMMLKARLNELPSLLNWTAAHDLEPSNIDLVINLADVSGYDPGVFTSFVAQVITTNIPNPPPWRTVTLAASSAPKDNSGLSTGRNNIPRLDWQLWQGVAAVVPFSLDYGDTGTLHPDLTEPPGVAMTRATVSVRYTVDGHWIIIKGRPTTGPHGQPMPQQYRAHATALLQDAQFGQLASCWADSQIRGIAGPFPKAGSRQTWASIALNRHMSLIANRLP